MGGGGSEQTTEASYPPEFAPLASAAVQRIRALQNRLPVEEFANFAPAATAGITPAHRFAMEDLLPQTMSMPAGAEGLFALQRPVGLSAVGATRTGAPTDASQMALRVLSRQLGVATPGQRSSADIEGQFQQALPNVAAPQTAFGSARPQDLVELGRAAAQSSVPILGGPGPSTLAPHRPLPASTFQAPFDMTKPGPEQTLGFLRGALDSQEAAMFDSLMLQGFTPEAAFNQVIGVRRAPPPPPPQAAAPVDTGGA